MTMAQQVFRQSDSIWWSGASTVVLCCLDPTRYRALGSTRGSLGKRGDEADGATSGARRPRGGKSRELGNGSSSLNGSLVDAIFPQGNISSAFTAWVIGPAQTFVRVPMSYVRASLVTGNGSARIRAAEHLVEVTAAKTEIAAVHAFTKSARTHAAMVSRLVNWSGTGAPPTLPSALSKSVVAAKERRNSGDLDVAASAKSGTSKKSGGEDAKEEIRDCFQATYESVLASEAAMKVAFNEVEAATIASMAAADATRAAQLKVQAEIEKNGGVMSGVVALVAARAVLHSTKRAMEIAQRGTTFMKKTQVAKLRLKVLVAHSKLVAIAAKQAEKAIAPEILLGDGDGSLSSEEAIDRAVVALERSANGIGAALNCSKNVAPLKKEN